MSARTATPVSGLVRWWVRLYTAGLPPGICDIRRAEIESDLWEQRCDSQAAGDRPHDLALRVFARWLLGIPADLLWRIDESGVAVMAGRKRDRQPDTEASAASKGLLGIAALMAAISVWALVGNSLAAEDSWVIRTLGRGWAVAIPSIPTAMIATGLGLNLKSRLLGASLMLVGVVGVGVLMLWTIVIPMLAGLAVALGITTMKSGGSSQRCGLQT